MKNKPVTNVAASIRRRLLNLARTRNIDFNALLAQYAIERFLFRLSKSNLSDRFVLKGALLFRVWAADLHRPTKDLDLLGLRKHLPNTIATDVKSIITTTVPDDGLRFDVNSVTVAEIREENEYGGTRVTLVAMLRNARIPMQIDIGFGDSVVPKPEVTAFPALLDQDAALVLMYPPESVVAEKLEAIIRLGFANSRMKDFYDLLVVFRTFNLNDELLAKAIAGTFNRRKTLLPTQTPVGLSDEFARDPVVQRRWSQFLRRLQIKDAPQNFDEVTSSILARVSTALGLARS